MPLRMRRAGRKGEWEAVRPHLAALFVQNVPPFSHHQPWGRPPGNHGSDWREGHRQAEGLEGWFLTCYNSSRRSPKPWLRSLRSYSRLSQQTWDVTQDLSQKTFVGPPSPTPELSRPPAGAQHPRADAKHLSSLLARGGSPAHPISLGDAGHLLVTTRTPRAKCPFLSIGLFLLMRFVCLFVFKFKSHEVTHRSPHLSYACVDSDIPHIALWALPKNRVSGRCLGLQTP